MKIKHIEYYFVGLLVLTFIGFWPSYFSTFFDGSADFTKYFHFHVITALLWIFLLITQPILIRKKRHRLHKKIGKASYILVPLLFISILLLSHHRADPDSDNLAMDIWIPFKDLMIFSFGYGVAIYFKNTPKIHARGMIVAGMALIEPVAVRVVLNVIGMSNPPGYLVAIAPVYLILIILIFLERKETIGRWVFPTAIVLFFFIHSILIFQIKLSPWTAFASWFVSLPLT